METLDDLKAAYPEVFEMLEMHRTRAAKAQNDIAIEANGKNRRSVIHALVRERNSNIELARHLEEPILEMIAMLPTKPFILAEDEHGRIYPIRPLNPSNHL